MITDDEKEFKEDQFSDLLNQPFDKSMILNLSKCSIIQIIDEMVKVKTPLSPGYGKRYKYLKHHLTDLQDKYKCVIMPYQITDVFWSNFIPYLIGKKISMSTIKTLSAQLISALTWGSKHGAILSPTYDSLKISPYSKRQIALTPDEVSHIYHFDIDALPRRKQYKRQLKQVRDLFVLSCNLGQRYSDMIRIDCTNFNRNIFSIVQQKTGHNAVVNIDKLCIDRRTTYEILERYAYNSPYSRDISGFNRALKELLRYIGGSFNDMIKIEQKVGGTIKSKVYSKWELISSHTGRRTFATYNYTKGIDMIELKKATGHKTNSSIEKYLCYYD